MLFQNNAGGSPMVKSARNIPGMQSPVPPVRAPASHTCAVCSHFFKNNPEDVAFRRTTRKNFELYLAAAFVFF